MKITDIQIKEFYKLATMKVKAGNADRPQCVTALMAHKDEYGDITYRNYAKRDGQLVIIKR